jgi:ABC-type sugar transport system ATPase subunit
VADAITVFRDGEYITTQRRTETTPAEIVRAMVGREVNKIFPGKATRVGDPKLSIRNFSLRPKFADVSLTVHRGEILGLAGLTGAGRSEVMQALCGYGEKDSGEVTVDGAQLSISNPGDAIRARIVYAPEDRKQQGLFLDHSITMNIAAAALPSCSGTFLMSSTKETGLARRMVDALAIRIGTIDQDAGSLSGGNQQKVLLAKCLAARPDVLIVDEPTRGIDIGSKVEIYGHLRAFAERGGAVILVSSELPEILGLSDRIAVFHGGRITGMLSEDISEKAVVDLMFMHSENEGAV